MQEEIDVLVQTVDTLKKEVKTLENRTKETEKKVKKNTGFLYIFLILFLYEIFCSVFFNPLVDWIFQLLSYF